VFEKRKLMKDGLQAQALVLEKKAYASGVETGRASACRYKLQVKFEDGSTTEITRRVWTHKLADARVGDLIPVRYDPDDRDTIEIDRVAVEAQREAAARRLEDDAIARGERELEQS
jgi:hypothetical protein